MVVKLLIVAETSFFFFELREKFIEDRNFQKQASFGFVIPQHQRVIN